MLAHRPAIDMDDLSAGSALFAARMGRRYGFRLKDFADFKSCTAGAAVSPLDQGIGSGDGATKVFALSKNYVSGPASWTRKIQKPVAGTLRVAVAGTEISSGFSLDDTTGLVTFASAPDSGAAISAGFEFDCPVRFDTDGLSINLASFQAGEIPSIPLVEILL